MNPETLLKAFKEKINKTYKGEVLKLGSDVAKTNLATKRFSSGIFSCDMALGGGWPFGKIVIDAGDESTGKTLKAIKACVSIQEYDHMTRQHKDYIKEGRPFRPGRALYIDAEGSWDEDWATRLGFDHDHHMIAQCEFAEQAIDIANGAIRENLFDIIVIDSIAALIPMKELEDSMEDWQMGLAARLVNKAMRKWVGSLNKLKQTTNNGGPCIYCLNQFRIDINAPSFIDPRVLPGGKAQRFACSILGYTKGPKVEDGDSKETEWVTLGGVWKKNKTYLPKLNYEFKMRLKDSADGRTGDVENINKLVEEGLSRKLIKKVGAKVVFGKVEVSNERAFKERLRVSPVLQKQLWRSIVKQACGVLI